MTPRAVSFVTGFACGALIFIAMQSFGQGYVECAETGWRCQPPELPALGELPKDRKSGSGDKAAEREKSLLIPVAVTVGMIGVLSLWGGQSNMPCATYPCAHYAHVGTGAAVGYLFTSYYSPQSALVAGLAIGVGKELMDKHNGKSFSRTDVMTRLLGTGVGIYLAKTF